MSHYQKTTSRVISSVTETSLSLDGISLCLHAWSSSNTFFRYSGKYPVVLLVLKGEYTINVSKNHFVCSSGTAIIIYNQLTHTRPSAFVDGGTLTFSFELTPAWCSEVGIQLPPVSSHTFPKAGFMNELMFRLYKEYNLPDEDAEHAVHALLLEITLFLKREYQAPVLKIPNWVSQARKIIEKQYSEKLTLLSLAKVINLDYSYLSDAFPKYFSTSFNEYLFTLRVEKAAILLADKNISIDDIAFLCGFYDKRHLEIHFYNHFGTTPDLYRNAL